MKNVFLLDDVKDFQHRIQSLKPNTSALWGKMNVSQMLAHCNVTYELVFDNKHPKPKGLMKFILKYFVKNMVVNEKPFSKNSRTAPAFLIVDERIFEIERNRLISNLYKTQELGEAYFDGKESHSFGTLNKTQWNNMFAKHLDHHLQQFGV